MAAPTLETPRLLIRPWRDSDVVPWCAMNADPRVMEFFRSTATHEESTRVAAHMHARLERDGFGWWVVDVKGDVPFAGVLALQRVPFRAPFAPVFEIGWRFAAGQWGRGYATEGARVLMRYAFEDLARNEIVALTAAVNVRSQRVMQKLGMTYDVRDDFELPTLAVGHPLRPHVLYRAQNPAALSGA